ncbi:Uncharacterized protein Rs2_04868 [Raphanus sativus]|nr:Uncharacterized protein Rs2_04868 [Raphanus sativus]
MISKYSDHNLHHWIRLIQQTRSNPSLSFSFLSTLFFYDIHALRFFIFFFLLSHLFGSFLSLHISSFNFISSSPPHRRPSRLSPPPSFDSVVSSPPSPPSRSHQHHIQKMMKQKEQVVVLHSGISG